MGRRISLTEHKSILNWGMKFQGVQNFKVSRPVASSLAEGARRDLRLYWNLANLSRASLRRPELAPQANRIIFRVRTKLEQSLRQILHDGIGKKELDWEDVLTGNLFGCSIKQGVSLRMPLTTCVPTRDCAPSCYAHDGMDAGWGPVIRGVINGLIAAKFEDALAKEKSAIKNAYLVKQVKLGVSAAVKEARNANFPRQPRIRFPHVGEIAAYSEFANELASLVFSESSGKVACVIYSRHPKVADLNPDLFVVNFTLDRGSMDRYEWIPKWARAIYSAWDGEISPDADINFLEHHHNLHKPPRGQGYVCPSTKPGVLERTCDAVRCDKCFVSAYATNNHIVGTGS